jgi:germination protein M
MKFNKTMVAIALAILLIVLAFVFFQAGSREVLKKSLRRSQADSTAATLLESAATKKVILYFVREQDGLLAPEERDIRTDPSVVREAEAVVAELIKGPSGDLDASLPPETKLSRVFVTNEGTAYVDLSRDLIDNHPSGTTAELATIYSVVNSLTANFKAIKKVFILIEGEERETLGGHIGLDRPFLPNASLIAKK